MKTQILLLSLFLLTADADEWFSETLYDSWRQTFSVDEMLFEMRTEHQELVIFRNKTYGAVLALDGVIQSTERDEFVYHEMMAHVPLVTHPNPRQVLIIGGGDGGLLREVLRHPEVEGVTLVEIDRAVIDMSRTYLPNHSQGAFDDPRLTVVIQDGCVFVAQTDRKFDAILSDSTDPIGPGGQLFTSTFYQDCARILTPDGIFVCQNGVPFMQTDELVATKQNLSPHFNRVTFYTTVVPTYVGGMMTLGFATNSSRYDAIQQAELAERASRIEGSMKYYTPELHVASFALPAFMRQSLSPSQPE